VAGASAQPFPRDITTKKSLGGRERKESSQAIVTKRKMKDLFNDGRLDNANSKEKCEGSGVLPIAT
jgi:hypothetical protein